MEEHTPKQRMLNAYRGIDSDRRPVAPEFWYYVPAKVLGVGMMEFEREIPLWRALKATFAKYCTEGWGIAFPDVRNPDLQTVTLLAKVNDGRYRETKDTVFRGKKFQSTKIYDSAEPSWVEKRWADGGSSLDDCLDMLLSDGNAFDLDNAVKAHAAVGEDYLLELCLGVPFFDLIAEIAGFEDAVAFFRSGNDAALEKYRQRFIEYQIRLIREACEKTGFESFMIGCSFSCNSLIGPEMWRKWDKPYIKAMADEIHRLGRLLHIHFHGRSIETAGDFAGIGVDCVCPFERGPGGDVDGAAGLHKVRELLRDKVTFNGNVHTVETLIRGGPEDVRREVREIKDAFRGSARLIIGTGDQVGVETPEENIAAMIGEAKKP